MTRPAPAAHRRADAFVDRVLGPVEPVADHTRQAGRVVEVRDRDGAHWIVKTTPADVAFRRERFAYRHWVPRLADQAPGLRAASAATRTLVLQRLPGDTRWTFVPDHHHDAGRLLRRLHDAAPPTAHGPTVGHLAAQRLDNAFQRCPEDALSPAEREFALAAVPELHRLAADLPRVPCHGDFGGHNWLRGPDGGLSVIDFSASRRTTAMSDFARLYAGPWWFRPRLVEAFFEGYGRRVTAEEAACIRLHMRALTVSHVVTGRRTGDLLLEQRGRQRLHALMDGRGPLAGRRRRRLLAVSGRLRPA